MAVDWKKVNKVYHVGRCSECHNQVVFSKVGETQYCGWCKHDRQIESGYNTFDLKSGNLIQSVGGGFRRS